MFDILYSLVTLGGFYVNVHALKALSFGGGASKQQTNRLTGVLQAKLIRRIWEACSSWNATRRDFRDSNSRSSNANSNNLETPPPSLPTALRPTATFLSLFALRSPVQTVHSFQSLSIVLIVRLHLFSRLASLHLHLFEAPSTLASRQFGFD